METFYANKICTHLKKKKNIFLIDGDEIRKYLTYKLKYSVSDRRKFKFIQDCKYLEKKISLLFVQYYLFFHLTKKIAHYLKNIYKYRLKLKKIS